MIELGQYLKTDGNFIEKYKYWDIHNDNELINTNLDQAPQFLKIAHKSLKLNSGDVKWLSTFWWN